MARKSRSDRPKRSGKDKSSSGSKKRYPNRRQHRKQSDVDQPKLKGTIQLSGDGSGRLIPEKKGADHVFLHPEEVAGLHTGDLVTAELHVGRGGKVKGRIVEVHEHTSDALVVGIVHENRRGLFVVPRGGGIPIVLEDSSELEVDTAVIVRLTERGDDSKVARGELKEVLGDPDHEMVAIQAAILATGLPNEFPEAVLKEADSKPDVDPKKVLDGLRKDLREVTHVTIDGADARDFDDAVAAVEQKNGTRIWVSIADVATYVQPGSALDDEAQNRATSVYFPHMVLPMLPEKLSNGLCSLRPDELRLAMTCEFLVAGDGKPQDIKIYPSLIKSAARLTYEQAQSVLDNTEEAAALPEPVRKLILRLHRASACIRKERQGRGCLELELPEARVVVDEENKPVTIVRRDRIDTHKLIEDLMIAANESVASYLLNKKIPGMYRIHEPPKVEKLKPLKKWAKRLGIKFDWKRAEEPATLGNFVAQLQEHDPAGVVQMLLLQSLPQARYSPENEGHFGLASEAYLHFTSPIRRYPDLLVHRALWQMWKKKGPIEDLEGHARNTSSKERRAVSAERDVTQLMGCFIAKRHVGESMTVTVMGVHSVGAFVRANELFVEGLLPIESIGRFYNDYFECEPEEGLLRGENGGHNINMGDELEVVLAQVDPDLRRINFAMDEGDEESEKPAATPSLRAIQGRKPRLSLRQEQRNRSKKKGRGGSKKRGSKGKGGRE